ncbi:hypothetical protein NDA13_006010 [Ustilago tritici]|nr:hypothetical protein NDA13_006010 [Ustilago tritici]
MSTRQTRLQAAANAPPPEAASAPTKHCRIIVRLRPRETSAPAANLPPSPDGPVPLEPLFLGMDNDTVVSSAPDSPLPTRVVPSLVENNYSPASPPLDLYDVDAEHPLLDLTAPEHQAAWEAELARTPTPPPTADEVVDAVLASSQAVTLVYQLEVQSLTPPPCWVGCCTPPPPPPDCLLPTNGEIAGWLEQFVVADLVVHIADGFFPCNWDVPSGSLPERRLQCLAMLCLTEGCMPWPSWQCRQCFNLGVPCFASAFSNPFGECNWIPGACVHCYLTGLGHCKCDIPAHPGIEYPGDSTPSLQPRGSHQAERAHLVLKSEWSTPS